MERNELLRENFENILLKNLNNSISGYFYKRKSYYFDKKDKIKSNFLSGLLLKLTASSVKYDRRFFKIDVKSSTFSYAKDETQIDTNPHYKVMLRDIVSVSRNMVSMPYDADSGEVKFKEVSIFDTNPDIDRGPNDKCQNVFEVKIENRWFTLYTDENMLMEEFVLYIEKILELRDQLRQKQKMEDIYLDEVLKNHQI